jgi:hypothetical protein
MENNPHQKNLAEQRKRCANTFKTDGFRLIKNRNTLELKTDPVEWTLKKTTKKKSLVDIFFSIFSPSCFLLLLIGINDILSVKLFDLKIIGGENPSTLYDCKLHELYLVMG